jgi:hypothetical protein
MTVFGLFQGLLAGSLVFYLHRDSANPDPEFFGVLAGVGATIFVSFIVEMSAIALWATRYDATDDLLNGESTALAISGVLGIGFAVALANHDPSQDLTWLESFGYGWSIVSLAMLALLVAAYPLMLYERNRPSPQRNKKST